MAAANQYRPMQFLPAFTQRFAVAAAETGTVFVSWMGTGLADILCVQGERLVANDNTVRYQGHLQAPINLFTCTSVPAPLNSKYAMDLGHSVILSQLEINPSGTCCMARALAS